MKVLNAAVMAVLVLAVTFFSVMLNPTARAWFERVVTQWQTYGVEFIFRGSAEGEAGTWAAGYLPEGYTWDGEEDLLGLHSILYTNPAGGPITLDYTPIEQGRALSHDSKHSDAEHILINNRAATIFRSNTHGFPSYLVWTDKEETTIFRLMAEIDPDEMVRIATSVTLIK